MVALTKRIKPKIYRRLLSGVQLFLLALISKNEKACASQIAASVELISKGCNNGVELFTISGVNRTLDKLEQLGYLHSWEERGELSRGMPRRMFSLTFEGGKILELQKLYMLMSETLILPD